MPAVLRSLLLVASVVLVAAAPARAQEPPRDIETYVLFAFDEMVIKGSSLAAGKGFIRGGNIGVNFPGRATNNFSLSYATTNRAIMDADKAAVADSVRADNPEGVFGDLFANSVNTGFAATILGSGPIPFTTPIIPEAALPVLPFTPGRPLTDTASDVRVGGAGGLPSGYTFAPGAFRDVRCNDGVTVNFPDGVFDMRSLSLGVNVTVNVTDRTILQIDRNWTLNDGTRLGVGTNSGARIYLGAFGFPVSSQRVTNFSHFAEIHAQIFSPTGWIDFGGDNELFGRIWAQRITGDPDNNITHVPPDVPPPDGELDDPFLCHEVHRPVLGLAGVSLVDQLGASTVTVKRPKRFCAPTNVNGADPDAVVNPLHHTYYTIVQTSPKFTPIKLVTVTNVLGTHVLDVAKPDRLLVPASKGLTAPPAPLAAAANHYKCYRVRGTFRATGLTVEDQFGPVLVDVKRPLHLCLPAEKNGEPIVDGELDYVCYQARGVRQTPRPAPFFTHNQFGDDTVEIFGPRDLCVKSELTFPD